MAGASLLTLIDDIASLLDDIAVLTKVAARKTAGVLGDDLALNAQQVAGVRAERELPVVWAVAKGSLKNKAILVPAALLISVLVPWLITPLLMLGGAFLCFEGFEKLWHARQSGAEDEHAGRVCSVADPAIDLVALERDKIAGAVRTDFILSAEIMAISLGAVASAPLMTQFSVLTAVALLLTVGVYGLVAAIVKMDDAGLYLSQRGGALQSVGRALLVAAPWLMKTLSIVGTAAMFMVGGGILVHGLGPVHHLFAAWTADLGPWGAVVGMALDGGLGVIAGACVLAGVTLIQRLRKG